MLSLVLLLLSLISAQADTGVNTTACDRYKSRRVEEVVQKFISPKVAEVGYSLPAACPLLPNRSIFRQQEQHKVRLPRGQWKCNFCAKLFRSEHYVDLHMDSAHAEEISKGNDFCPAQLYDVLHAKGFAAEADGEVGVWGFDRAPCREREVAKRRADCQAIGDTCFPMAHGKAAALLHDYFAGHFCGAHTCNHKDQHRLLTAVAKARRRPRWGYRIFAGIVVFLIFSFYIGLLYYHRHYVGYRTSADVRRLRQGGGFFGGMFERKKKVY